VPHQVTGIGGARVRGTELALSDDEAPPGGQSGCRVVFAGSLLRTLAATLDDEAGVQPQDVGRRQLVLALAREELRIAGHLPIGISLPRSPDLRLACDAALSAESCDCSLQRLAEISHLSARTLARRFQYELATPFSQWRRQVRLARMVKLWAEGNTLGACAAAVGYNSPSALSFMVRRLVGMPPSRLLASRAEVV
jgi:AraC-like DNA-binding protein